ncbi:ABC1 kinase family protein [Novosphingobium olei]|uniref:ABC1 kinase family protein n=1 Tax=Novosphingobium olei TaxID=2728851 RepID=UPI00308AC709|nr:AarF/UbiB family protein [Novosphingobium olei]
MLISTLAVAARDRDRLQELSGVASRFGLGVLLNKFGIEGARGDDGAAVHPASPPRRVRLALEELGPTFVKLGQILATRSDMLGPEWIAELEQLHSQAPTVPFVELRSIVEDALGMAPEEAFETFDEQPLAAASMAQVHRATLKDGTAVVVKIQRPGIRPRMEADLRLMTQLAELIEQASTAARQFQPAALVRQLAAALLEELDFTSEARNAELLKADFARNEQVVLPAIHWQFTTPTVLVMDFIAGMPPRDAVALRAAGLDPETIAAVGADMVLDMILVNGRFHGDPHPGNLLCLPGNRLALIDLGMIGHVSRRRREEFIAFGQAMTTGDAPLLTDVLYSWTSEGGASREAARRASDRLIASHGGKLIIGPLIRSFMTLMRDEGLAMPLDLMLMFKALLTMDGVLSAIQPDFDLTSAMQGAVARTSRRKLDPGYWLPLGAALSMELSRLGEDAPRLVRSLVRRLEAEPAAPAPDNTNAIRRSGNIIAAAILVGSLIIAVAIKLN